MPSEDGERVICIILLQAKLETEGNNTGQGKILFFCYANVLLSKSCKVIRKDKRSEAAGEENSPLLPVESCSLTEGHMLWKTNSCCNAVSILNLHSFNYFQHRAGNIALPSAVFFSLCNRLCKTFGVQKSVQRRAHRVHGQVSGGITLWILGSYFTR